MKRNFKFVLAYDGTEFAGWQSQKGSRTVQDVLESALRQLVGKKVHLVGAGRTDSGVHAQGQVAHAFLETKLSLRVIRKALNAILPADVLVHSVRLVPAGFHARYSARFKRYQYLIWNRPARPLFDRAQVRHIPQRLNIKAMQEAAAFLRGRRDFRAFHSSGRAVSSTVRHLRVLTVRKEHGLVRIEAEADGFLYHMVRRIAGLLIEVGREKVSPGDVRDLLKEKEGPSPPTAPARGLCLMQVRYS